MPCLAKAQSEGAQGEGPIVYVDSGSTDGSVESAKAVGAIVVNLDMSAPFTAARARNAGFKTLQAGG
ncbi:MAG: glycosyltransferase [Parvularculaceae bacterium]